MLLGGFDGLHVGHRRLLACAKASGLPVGVMTIIGGKSGNIFTFSEREKIFKESGADFVFELPFAEIKNLSPTAFLEMLTREFNPTLFVCGEDFRFGALAKGTPEFIKASVSAQVEVFSLVEMGGEKISSRKVKELLSQGSVQEANLLLGEEFFLCGEVKRDRGVGRTIGFPTANIEYPQDKFPLKKGVYETKTLIEGREYKGITNYGHRPTFDDEKITAETYLDGFDGDLYGKILEIRFVRYLREIKKFESIEELQAQLQQDITRVRNEN